MAQLHEPDKRSWIITANAVIDLAAKTALKVYAIAMMFHHLHG